MNQEEKAISFIKKISDNTDNVLYSGNSGGKDSAVIDKLLQLSGITYESYHTNTTIDPPGTLKHIRDNYPHTEILNPSESMYELIKRKGFPTRLNRYCCEYLKEYGSVGKMVFEGVRSSESTKRRGRDYVQCDSRKWQKGAQHIYPIYDWTDSDVWDFIAKYKITVSPHYEHGTRLGCVACPLVTRKGHRESELKLYPKFYEMYKRAIHIGMSNNPQWKITLATGGNSELAMKWWLSGRTMSEYFIDYDFVKVGKTWKKTLIPTLFNSL